MIFYQNLYNPIQYIHIHMLNDKNRMNLLLLDDLN